MDKPLLILLDMLSLDLNIETLLYNRCLAM